jgi:apolipoprotein D and lipocalin family protein
MNKLLSLSVIILILSGCGKSTKELAVVDDFDVNKYLGKWYELARIDNRFERDLIGVTAYYKMLDDGQVEVINRGFNPTPIRAKLRKELLDLSTNLRLGIWK